MTKPIEVDRGNQQVTGACPPEAGTALSSSGSSPVPGLAADALQSTGAWGVSCVRRTMDGQRWYRVGGADGWEIAYVPFGDRTSEEYRSCTQHAHLIAAAPELYEALLEARVALAADVEEASDPESRSTTFRQVFVDRLAIVDAALAKARGETPND
jgi:hypothetical protein